MNPRNRKSTFVELEAQVAGAEVLMAVPSERCHSDRERVDVACFIDSDEGPASEVLFI